VDVREVLLQIWESLDVDRAQLVEDGTRLRADLGVDSTESVEVMVAIEDRLGIRMDNEDFERLDTFGDMVAYVEAALTSPVGRADRSGEAHAPHLS
jgi:acyl carrier protein